MRCALYKHSYINYEEVSWSVTARVADPDPDCDFFGVYFRPDPDCGDFFWKLDPDPDCDFSESWIRIVILKSQSLSQSGSRDFKKSQYTFLNSQSEIEYKSRGKKIKVKEKRRWKRGRKGRNIFCKFQIHILLTCGLWVDCKFWIWKKKSQYGSSFQKNRNPGYSFHKNYNPDTEAQKQNNMDPKHW